MKSISEVSNETGLTIEDIRLILMDANQNWEICTHVSNEEYELIIGSCRAKLNGDSNIAPVNSMPLENQQKLVQSASQILNHTLMLSITEEIALIDAIDETKNRVILHNHQQRQKQLAEALGSEWRDAKVAYIDSLKSLVDHAIPNVVVEPDSLSAAEEISKFKSDLGNLLTR